MNKDIQEYKIEEKDKILSEIENILINTVNVNPKLLCEENYDKAFSGKVFNLKGREILYIFYEVEKIFKIAIDVDKILNYEFNSINGIKQYIKNVS